MMTTCKRCGTPYMQAKSTSSLVLTYCGVLCETADLGFSLLALESLELPRVRRHTIQRGEAVVVCRDTDRKLAA